MKAPHARRPGDRLGRSRPSPGRAPAGGRSRAARARTACVSTYAPSAGRSSGLTGRAASA